ETLPDAFQREADLARRTAIADVFLHPVLGVSGTVEQRDLDLLPSLLEMGGNSIKFFLLFPHFDREVGAYIEATRRAAAGAMIPCEDARRSEAASASLAAAGKSAVRYYADAHPVISEVVATQRAVAMAELTGAPIYIVHLSSQRALAVCADAQARGVPVYVEV